MCYKGKCFHIIPIERGCLALAIISAASTGLTLLSSVVAGLLLLGTIIFFAFNDVLDRNEIGEAVIAVFRSEFGVFITIVFAASLIAFIFSALLCYGLYNRRPIFVLIYFFYGVVVALSSAVASVVHMSIREDPVPGIMGFLASLIYIACLVLVYQTYVKLRRDADIKDHIPLVQN